MSLRACLHEGGGPQAGEVTCGGLPHLSCKRDHIKMRDYMDRRVTPPHRVTSPTPPPYKQALKCSADYTMINDDRLGSVICDHSDHGRSNEPMNPLWTRIHRFIWSTMIQVISDHWSWSGSSQRNKPLESRLRQTADSSGEFLKIENEHLKTV